MVSGMNDTRLMEQHLIDLYRFALQAKGTRQFDLAQIVDASVSRCRSRGPAHRLDSLDRRMPSNPLQGEFENLVHSTDAPLNEEPRRSSTHRNQSKQDDVVINKVAS
jgi:hypothetical protein